MKNIRRLLWVEPFWVLLLGIPIILPGRLLPIQLQPYILLALFLFRPLSWLSQRASDHSTSGRISAISAGFSPLTLPFLWSIVWLPINVWASADPNISWVAAGYLLFGMALYSAFIHWAPARRHVAYTAGFLLTAGSVLTIVSLPIVIWKPDFRLFYLPFYNDIQSINLKLGETIHANVLAGVLVILLPLFIAMLLQNIGKSRYGLYALCIVMAVFLLGVLILTQSRGGYLAAGVALLCVLFLRWPRLTYAIFLVPLVILWGGRFLNFQAMLDQFSTDGSLGGWEVRLDIWTNSLQALADFIYTGIGIGTFTLVMPLLYPLRYPIEGYPHAHNLFLQIGLDLGLPGLIAYLAILINLFVMLIATLRSRYTTPLHRTLAIGATGSLVGMLVHGLLDAVTWGTKLAFMPWILFALITQLFLHTQAAERNATQSSS